MDMGTQRLRIGDRQGKCLFRLCSDQEKTKRRDISGRAFSLRYVRRTGKVSIVKERRAEEDALKVVIETTPVGTKMNNRSTCHSFRSSNICV